jgi:hypothetical protein
VSKPSFPQKRKFIFAGFMPDPDPARHLIFFIAGPQIPLGTGIARSVSLTSMIAEQAASDLCSLKLGDVCGEMLPALLDHYKTFLRGTFNGQNFCRNPGVGKHRFGPYV